MPERHDPQVVLDTAMQELRDSVSSALASIREQLASLRERQDTLVTLLDGLDAALGYEDQRPKGFKAIEVVALEAINAGNDEQRDGALTVPQIVEELRRRGWLPESEKPEGAVRAAIRRLRDRDPRWGLFKGRLYYHDVPRGSDDEEEDA